MYQAQYTSYVYMTTPCIYDRYTVVSDLEGTDNGNPLYGIILYR
jgi:hypothetical protein